MWKTSFAATLMPARGCEGVATSRRRDGTATAMEWTSLPHTRSSRAGLCWSADGASIRYLRGCSFLFAENTIAHKCALGIIIQPKISKRTRSEATDIRARLRNVSSISQAKSVGPRRTQRYQQLPCVRQYSDDGLIRSPREDDTGEESVAEDNVRQSDIDPARDITTPL